MSEKSATSISPEREAFEKWVRATYPNTTALERHFIAGEWDYRNVWARGAWEAWNASPAPAASAPEGFVVVSRDEAIRVLEGVANLVHVCWSEWGAAGSWSDYDQSVMEGMHAFQAKLAAAPSAPSVAHEAGAQEVYQLGCKMYGPAFGEQGRMYWIDCDKATYETERMAGGPCRVIAGTVARVECECGDVYPASAFKCDNCSASEPVSQGGGVDAEKVMALVTEYGKCRDLIGQSRDDSCFAHNRRRAYMAVKLKKQIRALLSASPAASVRPDCGTCANRGRVDGLSQEAYRDGR